MTNSISLQLGYKSVDELRKEYNGILELSNTIDIHQVINTFLHNEIKFSIDYNSYNFNVIVKF